MFNILHFIKQLFGRISVEQPTYKVLVTYNNFDIREYGPQIRATADNGGLTCGKGFKPLAGYIFGREQDQDDKERIGMTAPVVTTKNSMSFIMPSRYKNKEDLPKPKQEVKLVSLDTTIVAAKRFSGIATEDSTHSQLETLKLQLKEQGIAYDTTDYLYRYNPPHTLPFLRRNEAVVVLKTTKSKFNFS